MIDADGVAVSLGGTTILEDVSLSVDRGELVGLVGPNGAGKTTLLRTITAAIAPDRGTVRIDGDDVNGLSSRAASRRIATVPQNTSLSFEFPIREIVAMGRTPYRSRFERADESDRRAVERALERTAVADLAERSIDAVSGGERQRVLLARALAQETPALALDEPTASLDVHHQVATFDLVRGLVAEGTAAIAAVHDLDLAARFCDRLVLLAGGRVRAAGPPDDVLTADAIADAFGARAVVTDDPVTGTPSVTVLGPSDDAAQRTSATNPSKLDGDGSTGRAAGEEE